MGDLSETHLRNRDCKRDQNEFRHKMERPPVAFSVENSFVNVYSSETQLQWKFQQGGMPMELPRVVGISVVVGDPISLNDLRGTAGAAGQGQGQGPGGTPGLPTFVPVPVTPQGC